jgi:cytochrome c-type biogenesis protein
MARFSGKKTGGIPGAILLGFAFAAGWSPCIGPILGSILLFAGREGNIPQAALLLLSYSLGLALPFLATGLFFDRLKPLLSFLTKHGKEVRLISGLVLILFGIAMAAGSLGSVSALAARAGYGLEAFVEASPETAKTIGAALWASIGTVFAAIFAGAARRAMKNKARLTTSSLVAAALSLAGFVLAVAESAGAFSTLSLLSGWLTFAGF